MAARLRSVGGGLARAAPISCGFFGDQYPVHRARFTRTEAEIPQIIVSPRGDVMPTTKFGDRIGIAFFSRLWRPGRVRPVPRRVRRRSGFTPRDLWASCCHGV